LETSRRQIVAYVTVRFSGGSSESLEPDCGDQDEIAEGLGTIRTAIDMARDLTAGLGSLMRPEMPRSQHDLRDLLRVALDLLGTLRIARHDVCLGLPEAALPIWANPTELLQVVVNLAINACDSGAEGDVATVTIRAMPAGTPPPSRLPDAGERVPEGSPVSIFTVADTGAGIAPEVLARMFQRNFTTKGQAGTGLGLLIVSSILQGNSAALWVDTVPGKGSTMTVAWPCRAVAPWLAPAATPSQAKRPTLPARPDPDLLRGVRALVVDDLPDVSRVLAEMLESAGATAFPETDPHLVKQVLSEAPRDWSVLVTDLHMPGCDGHALARFAMTLSPPVPVVLVTARPDTLGDFSLRDFAAVLSKPVGAADLAHAVRATLDARKTAVPDG